MKLSFHKLDWLEKLAIGFSTWFIIYPEPYDVLLVILLVFPILGIVLNGKGKSSIATLVDIRDTRDFRYKYDVADFIDLPAWAILLRVLLDFEFDSFKSILIPGAIGFLLMLLILITSHNFIKSTNKNMIWIYSALVFNVFLYSYAGTSAINCVFDDSKPQKFEVQIVDKNVSHGSRGRKTYYLTVTHWGSHFENNKIRVSKSQFNNYKKYQWTKVNLKHGLFKIPWYYVGN